MSPEGSAVVSGIMSPSKKTKTHFSRRNPNLCRKMLDLPLEIVSEILSFVLAESVLRFRCVSKSWRALIDSHYFIKLHLNRAIQTNSDRKLFSSYELCYAADFNLIEDTNRAEFAKQGHPFKYLKGFADTMIVGSCHGVLYLHNYFEKFALWNPTTQRSIELPNSNYNLSDVLTHHGFGYDEVTDDYKVVRIWPKGGEAQVFSLKSNSWRSISPFPYHFIAYQDNGVLAGGSLHWVVHTETESEKTYFIASFDLGTEEYSLVPHPDYSFGKCFLNLAVLGGSLCAYTKNNKGHCDYWAMKKYGCKDSWTKLFTYSSNIPADVKPLAYSRNGRQVLMLEEYKHLWYDLETGEVKYSTYMYRPYMSFPQMCFGSLVQVDGSISDNVVKLWEKSRDETPPKKLELFSRVDNLRAQCVRKALCKLKLPYILHYVGRGSEGERLLLEKFGESKVPCLIDPNTDTRIGDYNEIIPYLFKTYSLGTY